MIVMTVKKRVKWVVFGILTAISAVILAMVLFLGAKGEQWAVVADLKYSLTAGSAEERIAFLGQFGWVVEEEPVAVEEVAIPAAFNDVYQNYNALQQEQGLDLTPYAGKTCKRWVYQVLNYPRDGERILATLLVYDGRIIGGDISSSSLDGFMAGFLGEHGLMRDPATDTVNAGADSTPQEEPAESTAAGVAASTTESETAAESELPAGAYPTD